MPANRLFPSSQRPACSWSPGYCCSRVQDEVLGLAGWPWAPPLSHRQKVAPAGFREHSPGLWPGGQGHTQPQRGMLWCVRVRGGGGGWEHNTQRHTSLSLFPSQDLKFNYISKEINFKVPFYARVKYVHCQVCAACDSTCGSFPEPVPSRQLPALCPGAPPTGHLSSLLTRRRRSVAHSTLYHTFPSNKNLGMFTAQVSASGMHTATLRIEKCPLPCPLHRRRFSGPPAAPSSSSRDRSKASTPQ